MLKKRFIVSALAVSGLGLWLARPAPTPDLVLDRTQEPGLIQEMSQFQQVRLGEDGQPQDILSGKSLKQLQDGSSQIAAPEIASSQGWLLQADNATTDMQSDAIVLNGNVRIRSNTEPDSKLTTQQLSYSRQSQSAETDKAVTISGNRYRLASQGMRIDLEAGTMQLLANTRGTYEISGTPAGSDAN